MLLQIRLPGLRDALDSLRSSRDESVQEPAQEEPGLRLKSLARALESPPPIEEPPAAARDVMPRPPVRREGVLSSLQGLGPQTPEEQAELDRINAEKRIAELAPTIDRYVAQQRVVRPPLEPSTPAERAETDRLIGPVPVGIEGPNSIPPSDPARRGTITPTPEPSMGRRLGSRFLAGIAKVNPIFGEYARTHLDLPETGRARRERLTERAEAGSLTLEDEADVAETFRDPGGTAGQVGEFAGELVGDPASVLLPFVAGERAAMKGLETAASRGVPGVGRYLRAATVDPSASLARRMGQRALARTGTFGTGAAASEIPHRLREEGRLPTPGELGTAFAVGTATGPVFGAGEELAITGARAAGRAMSDAAAARELGVPRNASEDVARRAFLDRYTRDFGRWERARPGTDESAAAFNDAQRAATAFERLRRRGGWRGRREPVPESEIPGPRPPEADRPAAPPSRQLEGPRAEAPAPGAVAPRPAPPEPSAPAPEAPPAAPVRPAAEAPSTRPLEGPAPARPPGVVRPDMPTSREADIEVEAMDLAELGQAEYDARRELLEVAGDERAEAILRRAEEIRHENLYGPELNQAPEEAAPPRRAATGGLAGPEVRVRVPSDLVEGVPYDELVTYGTAREAIEHAENLAPGAVEVLQVGPGVFQVIRPKSPNQRLIEERVPPSSPEEIEAGLEGIDPGVARQVDAEIEAGEGRRAIDDLVGPETVPERWPESTEERMRREGRWEDPEAPAETPEELAALVPEAIEIDGRPAVMRGPDGVIYATVRAGDIIRDPERIQFKRVGSEGVTQRLPGEYSPHLAGAVDVTRLTGETGMFLENGFHRHLKALEAGEDTPIPVRLHPESTPEQARRRGALMNIGEGHATPIDAAKLIREEGLTTETLADANIDLRKDVARLGVQLAKLPDDIFTRVATGDLTDRMGAAIGDSGLSEAGMRGLEKLVRDQPDMTIQQVRELARFVEGAGETTASQETLFGTEELTRSNALEKAKLSASIKRRLARDRSLFRYVARPGRAERLEQAGAGEIELERARDLAESAAGLEEMYTKLSTVTGPVSDALNAAARDLAAGGNERDILDRLYDDVVSAIKADPDVQRMGGAEPDPNQQSLLGEPDSEYGLEGPDELPVDMVRTGPNTVGAGMDESLSVKMGANMYKGDVTAAAMKEGLQNAVDAMGPGSGDIRIEFDTSQEGRSFKIVDNGEGMTPDVAANEFMDIGGTTKGDDLDARGKFGFAKVALFAHSENFRMVTTDADGNTTRIEGSAKDWREGKLHYEVEEGGMSMYDAEGELLDSPQPRQQGTALRVKFEEDARLNWWAGESHLDKHLKYDQTNNRLTVIKNGQPYPQKSSQWSAPATRFTQDGPTHVVEVPGARVEIKRDELKPGRKYSELVYLNNGLYQFKNSHSWGTKNRGIFPETVLVDVKATVDTESMDYPWTTNREEVKDHVLKPIMEYLNGLRKAEILRQIDVLMGALNDSPEMPNSGGLRVFATSGTVGQETLERVAAQPYMANLAMQMMDVSISMWTRIQQMPVYKDIPRYEFGGIGISETYLGINIQRDMLEEIRTEAQDTRYAPLPDENLILVNPFGIIAEMDMMGDGSARALAEQSWSTLLHEVTHQLETGHEEPFVGAWSRVIAPVGGLHDAHVSALERVWQRALDGGILDEYHRIRGEWGGENLFESISAHNRRIDSDGADAELPVRDAAGDDPVRREGRVPDEADLRGAPRERPEGTRRRGAPVRGSDADVGPRLEGPQGVQERPGGRAEEIQDRLDEIDRLTEAEGRDETPEEVREIMRLLDELNDIAPSGPTYDAPISVPRQPGQQDAGEVREAQGEYEALRRRFVAAFKHPDTGEIIKGRGEPHVVVARQSPDEMRLLDEWDRETDNVGFVDADGTFYTRAQAERLLPPEVPPESQAIANYRRRNVFGRGRGEVREDVAPYDPGPDRFESRVAAAVQAAPFNAAPGSQWQGYLDNVEGGVSQVEVDAMGLTKYLEENADTKLTREQVSEFVAERGIRLGENVRGGRRADWQGDEDWPTPEIAALHDARQKARSDRAMAVADLTQALKDAGYDLTEIMSLTGPGAELVAPLKGELALAWREAIRDIQDLSNARQVSFATVVARPHGEVEDDAVKFYREIKAQVDEVRAGPVDPKVVEAFDDAQAARLAEEDADRAFADASNAFAQDQPKYEEFVLPGEYENYREIIVTLDRPGEKWVGPHWSEPNVAVHLRVTDRITTDPSMPSGSMFAKSGGKTLLVEEIQSDWAQMGRERGFRDRDDVTNELPPGTEMYEYDNPTGHYFQAVWSADSGRRGSAGRPAQSYEEAIREAWRERDRETVPYTPLNRTQDWVGIALQRALDEAVAGGYEYLAWTTGVQQAERYDIGRKLDELQWRRFGDDIMLVGYKDGKKVLSTDLEGAVQPGAKFRFEVGMASQMATLEDVVGKDLARQIRDTQEGGFGMVRGDELAVGAHGMRMFYDAIIPRELKKILKRLGAPQEIDVVEIPNDPPWPAAAGDDFEVHAIPITPELRRAVGSQPMRIMERGPDYEVREGDQPDMFGKDLQGPQEELGLGPSGPQRSLAGPSGRGQLQASENLARSTVERLRPVIEAGEATPEQREQYRQAVSLLRRNDALSADEARLLADPESPADTESGDLFGGLEGPSGVREPDPSQSDIFHDQVTWGGPQQAQAARKKIIEENRSILRALAPETRLRLVEEGEAKLRENLNIDLTSRALTIRKPQDVAPLAALFRSPKREILQAFLFGDEVNGERKMLGHMLVTTGEIGSAGFSKEQVVDLLDMIESTGATAVMLAHNHPSSDPTPSNEDRGITATIAAGLRGNGIETLGHIVVNHGVAVLMSGSDPWADNTITYDPDGMVDWRMSVGRAKSPQDVAIMAGKTAGKDGFTILYADSQNQPVALEMHPNSDVALFNDRGWLDGRMGELAASQVFVVIDEGNPTHDMIRDHIIRAFRKTVMGVGPAAGLRDVVSVNGDKWTTSAVLEGKLGQRQGGYLGTPRRLREGEGEYGLEGPGGGGEPPEGPPAPPATGGGEPPERPGRLEGVETGPYSADDFLRTKLNMTGLDRETERLLRAEFERATAATGTTRRRVSDEEVIARAHAIGQDGAALQSVLEGRGLDAAEQLALLATARSNTQRMGEALSRLAQSSTPGGKKLPEHERLELEREVERRAEINNLFLSKWAEEGSEAGRTLRARQLEAFAIDDEIAVVALAQRLKSRAGGRPKDLTVDEQNRIIAAVETGNKAALAEYLTSLDKQSPLSKFFAVIKAAMLSLAQTHMVNLTSNAIKFTAGPAERFYSSLADRAIARERAKITGEDFARTTMVGRGDVEGMKAFRQAAPKAGKAWWYSVSGKVPEEMSEEVIDALRRATTHRTDVRRRMELVDRTTGFRDRKGLLRKGAYAGGWAVEVFTNGVLGALGAGDVLFRHPAYVRSLWEQAGVHARREGLEKGTPEFTARVKKLVEDPTGAMERQAQLDSDESVFMDPTGFFDGVDDIIQKIKRGETKMGRPGQVLAESLAPFTRTLLGIADQTFDLTGLGLLRGPFNASRLVRYLKEEAARPDRQAALGQDPDTVFDANNPKDAEFLARIDAAQKRAAKQTGRGMLGATSFVLIAALGGYLAMRDRIKTRYPTDARERELWRAQDIRPNSILINGKWRQTDFLGPYGLALMIGAYVHDIATSEEDQRDSILSESIRFATSFAESMMRVIGAVTIAQGLETVSELTAGEEGSFEDYFRAIARMPYPNFLRGVARAIDPVRREADWRNVTDQYGVSTPWLSRTYPPRVDAFGNDIVGPEGWYNNMLSPSRGPREDKRQTDPLLAEADRLGTMPIRPRRSDVEGWVAAAGLDELTPDQWYRIQKRYGEAMAEITRSLINSPEYQAADDEAKRARLEQLWTQKKTQLNRELKSDIAERAQQRRPEPRLQGQPSLDGPRPAVGAP